ncbi:response regulator containing a CheY-like receiver domain and a GGDEF domain [Beggiatoa alba B18LD]|uniref:histidine kinase n=1 Tax=Beggiatoa alba B18LD TaxID=395493 RepID=I3CHI9_9GAMM|nr:response regulator [Beggiatoa alba]EIJ43082.1 response regulator containing a CheY-like receiver domain and a GGDEF domain [Beggiatoa alba B18LD]
MDNRNCVLIVDDEEHGRDALEMLLATENYQLAFASHGEEALRQAQAVIPDLILLDVMMPGMDGFEVCALLRANSKLAEVPILMLTALDDRESRLRGIEVGADDFITKPYDRVELRTRVRTIMRLNRYRRLVSERSRFEWVIENSEDGYLLINEYDVVQYANHQARLLLNLSTPLTTEKISFLPQALQTYQAEPHHAWQGWETQKTNIAEQRYLVRPETQHTPPLWLLVEVLELPLYKQGSILVHLQNVSERMNLQRQMWTFQTMVSHKLRGPLNGLVSLQMLEQKNMDLSSERAHSLLKIARESAKRLQDQILEILRYIDVGQMVRVDGKTPIEQIAEITTKIRWDLVLENIELHIADELHNKLINLSHESLELILRELLTNSKKFHPQQSPCIRIDINPCTEEQILMTVIDNGGHLSTEELQKIWMPYYQSEKSFTGEVKGMGLGLPMVAMLVWNRGGSCQLTNREGQQGVQVTLTLPFSN